MLGFWNETLKNISQDNRSDKFIFKVNNRIIEVPLSYALGISPLITAEYLKDPTFRYMEIKDNENEKIEKDFLNFIKGKKISKEKFLKIATILKNNDMIKKWKKSNHMTKETALGYIKDINGLTYLNNNNEYLENDVFGAIQEEIKYIAKHIEDMKEEVKMLKEDELIYIIKNENLSVKSEDTIWEIIKGRMKEMKNEIYNGKIDKTKLERMRKMRRSLLGTVKLQYLTIVHLKEYITEIEEEDIAGIISDWNHNDKEKENKNIWNQIQDIILNNIYNFKHHHKRIDHKIGKNFEGIIKYLEDKYGKNIHEQGIITITESSNGTGNRPEQVIDYEWDDFWYSNIYSGEWWQINFKKNKIKMTGYAIKTGKQDINWIHLKNWVIEGRNEGEDWKKIDWQDNSDLNGPSYQHYYSIQEMTEPYQYIRIKNIGKNHSSKNYRLVLNNFEIFGEIIEEE